MDLARTHDARKLRQLGRHILHVLDPEQADRRLGRQLEREERAATRATFLELHDNGDGTHGGRLRIPGFHAAVLTKMLDAIANPARPTTDAGDRRGPARREAVAARAARAGVLRAARADPGRPAPDQWRCHRDRGGAARLRHAAVGAGHRPARHRRADLRRTRPAAGVPGRGHPRGGPPAGRRPLGGPRPGPQAPSPHRAHADRAGRRAGRLHRRALRPARRLVPRPPRRPLVRGRSDQRDQRPAALLVPPPQGPLAELHASNDSRAARSGSTDGRERSSRRRRTTVAGSRQPAGQPTTQPGAPHA